MRDVVYRLALASVVLHMLLGCCLHHAHGDCSVVERGNDTSESACPCHPHDHENDGTPPEPRPGRHECEDSQCVFTRIESRGSAEVAGALTCWVSPGNVAAISLTEPSGDRPDFFHIRGTPLRLHLLNRVLLL